MEEEVTETAENEEAVAEQSQSPSETESEASPSDAAGDEIAEAIRQKFLEEYGDDHDPGEDGKPASEEETPDPKEEAEEPEADDDDESWLSDDEFKKLPESARKRIGQLSKRAKKAQREVETLTSEKQALEERATRFDQISEFVRENGIQPDAVSLAFGALAKFSKGEYEGFIEAIRPFYETAQKALGKSYDDDLAAQVEDGLLTEDQARALTQERMRAKLAEDRAKQAQAALEAQQRQAETATVRQRVYEAMSARESELRSTDPDFGRKEQFIRREIEAAIERFGAPQSPKDAVAMLNHAHEIVTEIFRHGRPQPKATPPRADNDIVKSGPAQQVFSSTEEALKAAGF